MHKLWVLIKREYAQVVKKKSFVVGIILTPVLMVGITIVPALLASKKPTTAERIAVVDLDGQGIGDQFAGRIAGYKLDDSSRAYEVDRVYGLAEADSAEVAGVRARLDSLIMQKAIKSYLIIPPDIERDNSGIMVAKSFGLRTVARFDGALSDILAGIRLEKSDINLAVDSVLALTRGVELRQQAPGGKQRDFLTIYLAGLIFVMIIFGMVIGYGQLLMRSVIEEKNSRIVEVMVSSLSPFQLMAGKVIGLGLASLTQVAAWVLIGVIIFLAQGSQYISADISDIIFNPTLIVFFLLYLMLGYMLFSTLFALIGSVVNTDKEAQNFVFPITMMLLLPIIIAMYIIQEPESTIAVILSLIPFFTPTMMIQRLIFIGPDTFNLADPIIREALLGLVLTFLTILGVIWVTSKIFRVGILMYGKRPTLGEIFRWVKYR